ncbi:MAG: CRISPR-associated endoribonuclease Cas6 [Tissierellia bacterium]|nr:CRISPR-associated endoribonuclease Cas6 [Tissierellia bacterium]
MLSKLEIHFKEDNELHSNMGSLFHGALIENIPNDYATKLHQGGLKPFTQSLLKNDEGFYWEITTTTKESYQNIVEPLLRINSIYIKKINKEIEFKKKAVETISKDDFIREKLFLKNPNKYITLEFISPTAFKSQDIYLNIPTSRLIIQSLLNKLDAYSDNYEFHSAELIENLENIIFFANYKLFSTNFHVEGQKIPSYRGEITISVNGPPHLVSLVHLLISFGEYSGVGMKTSLGMGKIRKKGSEQWIPKNTM